jgi:hypothetical protein
MAISASSNIPNEYICPITSDIMFKPAKVSPCLHVFEKAAIEDWKTRAPTCPMCRVEIIAITLDEELEKKIYAVSYPIKDMKAEDAPASEPVEAEAPKVDCKDPAIKSLPVQIALPAMRSMALTPDLDRLYFKHLDSDDCKIANRYEKIRNIANCYFYGLNVKTDRVKAFFYYNKSAIGNDPVALRMLGIYYLLGTKIHPGLWTDSQQGAHYLQKASELGDRVSAELHFGIRQALMAIGQEHHFGWKTISYQVKTSALKY